MAVYLMLNEGDGTVKIGYSENVQNRKKDIQVGNSGKIRLIRILDGGESIEKWFHRRFKNYHIRGEWFCFTANMMTVNPPDIIEKPKERKTSPSFGSAGASLANAYQLGLVSQSEIDDIIGHLTNARCNRN